MKIICRERKLHVSASRRSSIVSWKRAAPFVWNSRGKLVHRVKSVRTYLDEYGQPEHSAAEYWCGNQNCNLEFHHTPPSNKLVCARCEAKAVAAGEQASERLAGCYVGLGVLRSTKLCCINPEE